MRRLALTPGHILDAQEQVWVPVGLNFNLNRWLDGVEDHHLRPVIIIEPLGAHAVGGGQESHDSDERIAVQLPDAFEASGVVLEHQHHNRCRRSVERIPSWLACGFEGGALQTQPYHQVGGWSLRR